MPITLNNKASFRAYIDESGDEGFIFHPDGSGSSRWFVISALITRVKDDSQIVQCLKETRKLLNKPPKHPLHFVDLKHEQRVPYARRVGQLPAKTVSIMVHKPSIREPEKFQNESYLLYRFATKLLLERVSWLCRDLYIEGQGDRSCDVIFSNRSKMSYQDMRDYLNHLLSHPTTQLEKPQIDDAIIIPDKIRAVDHSRLAGLQAADAVASSIHYSVKRNRYGETEPSYSTLLKNSIYRHKKTHLGYGIKIWPSDLEAIKTKAPEAEHLESL